MSSCDLHHFLQAYPKQVLGLMIDAMALDQNLWDHYFNDFIICKLKLSGEDHTPEGDIAQSMLYNYFQKILSYNVLEKVDVLKKVVKLHSYFSVYQLDLAQMASILRPLNILQSRVSNKGNMN